MTIRQRVGAVLASVIFAVGVQAEQTIHIDFGGATTTKTGQAAAQTVNTNPTWNAVGHATTVSSNYNSTPVITQKTVTNLVWDDNSNAGITMTITNLTSSYTDGFDPDPMLDRYIWSDTILYWDYDSCCNEIVVSANPEIWFKDLPADTYDLYLYAPADYSSYEGFRYKTNGGSFSSWKETASNGGYGCCCMGCCGGGCYMGCCMGGCCGGGSCGGGCCGGGGSCGGSGSGGYTEGEDYVVFTNIVVGPSGSIAIELKGNDDEMHFINGIELVGRNGSSQTQLPDVAFSPGDGSETPATVTLSVSGHSGAIIYYTTDGSTPTASSSTYSSPLSVNSAQTIKAFATDSGYTDSDVSSASYVLPELPDVTFSPVSGTTLPVSMTLSVTGHNDVDIYYTTDGSSPTTNGTLYVSTVSLTTNDWSMSGDVIPNLTAWDSHSGNLATNSTHGSGLEGWQAFDGDPSSAWQATTSNNAWVSFEFPGTRHIAKYAVTARSTESDGPKAWTFEGWDGNQYVTLDTRSAVSNWTPGETKEFVSSNSAAYVKYRLNITEGNISSGNNTGLITIGDLEMFEAYISVTAYATKTDYTDSDVTSVRYHATQESIPEQVEKPQISPVAGDFENPIDVSIVSSTPESTIKYSTNGVDWLTYSSMLTDVLHGQISAYATKPGYFDSNIQTNLYTFTVADTTFSPEPGSYSGSTNVTLSNPTAGATIYYSIEGGGLSPYTGPISVDNTLTITAVATNQYFGSSTNSALFVLPSPNAEPVVTGPVALTTDEDTTLLIGGIHISDMDAGLENVEMTITAVNGVVQILDNGIEFEEGTNGVSATLKVSGPIGLLDSSVEMFQFIPDQDYYGTGLITISIDDLGNTGTGGAKTGQWSENVVINSVVDFTIDAGADSSVIVNQPLLLAGTIEAEEGAEISGIQWIRSSGDGEMTFSDSTSSSTTVTFENEGVHVLELRASIEGQIVVDSVIVTVMPEANQPPVIELRDRISILVGQDTNLIATVVDDGKPAGGTLAYQWSVVDGDVAISSYQNTIVNFGSEVVGESVLRLMVDDGELTSTSDVIVSSVQSVSALLGDLSFEFPTPDSEFEFGEEVNTVLVLNPANMDIASVGIYEGTSLVAKAILDPITGKYHAKIEGLVPGRKQWTPAHLGTYSGVTNSSTIDFDVLEKPAIPEVRLEGLARLGLGSSREYKVLADFELEGWNIQWDIVGDDASIVGNTESESVQVSADVIGDFVIRVTVSNEDVEVAKQKNVRITQFPNQLPEIEFTMISDTTDVYSPGEVEIGFTATDSDGYVKRIDIVVDDYFYTSVSVANSSFFVGDLLAVPHELVAFVYDNDGEVFISDPFQFSVELGENQYPAIFAGSDMEVFAPDPISVKIPIIVDDGKPEGFAFEVDARKFARRKEVFAAGSLLQQYHLELDISSPSWNESNLDITSLINDGLAFFPEIATEDLPADITFTMEVFDGELKSTDSFEVKYHPQNFYPTVKTATNRYEITVSQSLTNLISLEDEYLPDGRSNFVWVIKDAPGQVIFSDQNATNSNIEFMVVGEYRLIARADDEYLTNFFEIEVDVLADNYAPATPDHYLIVEEDGGLNIDLGVTDQEGDVFSVIIAKNVDYGSLTGSGNSWIYEPDDDFYGTDYFVYRAEDGNGSIPTEGIVTISVTSENDIPTFSFVDAINLNQDFGSAGPYMATVDPFPANEADQDIEFKIYPGSLGFVDLMFDSTTGQLNLTSKPYRNGSALVEIVCTDNGKTSASHTNTVLVEVSGNGSGGGLNFNFGLSDEVGPGVIQSSSIDYWNHIGPVQTVVATDQTPGGVEYATRYEDEYNSLKWIDGSEAPVRLLVRDYVGNSVRNGRAIPLRDMLYGEYLLPLEEVVIGEGVEQPAADCLIQLSEIPPGEYDLVVLGVPDDGNDYYVSLKNNGVSVGNQNLSLNGPDVSEEFEIGRTYCLFEGLVIQANDVIEIRSDSSYEARVSGIQLFDRNQSNNLAPTVSMPDEMTVIYGAPININPTISDDDLPQNGQLSVSWQVDKPELVEMEDSGQGPLVAYPKQGQQFVFRVTVGDGALTTSKSITVNVESINEGLARMEAGDPRVVGVNEVFLLKPDLYNPGGLVDFESSGGWSYHNVILGTGGGYGNSLEVEQSIDIAGVYSFTVHGVQSDKTHILVRPPNLGDPIPVEVSSHKDLVPVDSSRLDTITLDVDSSYQGNVTNFLFVVDGELVGQAIAQDGVGSISWTHTGVGFHEIYGIAMADDGNLGVTDTIRVDVRAAYELVAIGNWGEKIANNGVVFDRNMIWDQPQHQMFPWRLSAGAIWSREEGWVEFEKSMYLQRKWQSVVVKAMSDEGVLYGTYFDNFGRRKMDLVSFRKGTEKYIVTPLSNWDYFDHCQQVTYKMDDSAVAVKGWWLGDHSRIKRPDTTPWLGTAIDSEGEYGLVSGTVENIDHLEMAGGWPRFSIDYHRKEPIDDYCFPFRALPFSVDGPVLEGSGAPEIRFVSDGASGEILFTDFGARLPGGEYGEGVSFIGIPLLGMETHGVSMASRFLSHYDSDFHYFYPVHDVEQKPVPFDYTERANDWADTVGFAPISEFGQFLLSPYGMNDQGVVVGGVYAMNPTMPDESQFGYEFYGRGFVWNGEKLIRLGAGYHGVGEYENYSVATDINESGEIAFYELNDEGSSTWLISKGPSGGYEDYSSIYVGLDYAKAINNSGQIVGNKDWSGLGQVGSAAVWSNLDGVKFMGNMVDPDFATSLMECYDINDGGEILVRGVGGNYVAYPIGFDARGANLTGLERWQEIGIGETLRYEVVAHSIETNEVRFVEYTAGGEIVHKEYGSFDGYTWVPASSGRFYLSGRVVLVDGTEFRFKEHIVDVWKDNEAPVVRAGGDFAVNVSKTLSLEAEYFDDGLPVGGGVTTTWTQVSGPIANLTGGSGQWNVSFNEIGMHEFEVSIFDGALTGTDRIQIEVLADNIAPTVSFDLLTSGECLVAPASVSLEVNCSDLDGIVETLWIYLGEELVSEVSAPGDSFLLNLEELRAGTKELRAVVVDDDGELGGSGVVPLDILARYSVLELGRGTAYAINENGEITGELDEVLEESYESRVFASVINEVEGGTRYSRAFKFNPHAPNSESGDIRFLQSLYPGARSRGRDIDNDGTVVGSSETYLSHFDQGIRLPTIWENGSQIQSLGGFVNDSSVVFGTADIENFSEATGISDGVVVGVAGHGQGFVPGMRDTTSYGFVLEGGALGKNVVLSPDYYQATYGIGSLFPEHGYRESELLDVNGEFAVGYVSGFDSDFWDSETYGGAVESIYQRSIVVHGEQGMVDLGVMNLQMKSGHSLATCISSQNRIGGYEVDVNGNLYPYVWLPDTTNSISGTMTPLVNANGGRILAITDVGDSDWAVVGVNDAGEGIKVLSDYSVLNVARSISGDYRLGEALGINSYGQIVGAAYKKSQTSSAYDDGPYAVLLTPVQDCWNVVGDAPTIAIDTPSTGAVAQASQGTLVTVTAADVDGDLGQVVLFDNGVEIGTFDSNGEIVWIPSLAGEHVLLARANDLTGKTTDSESIRVVVTLPPGNTPPIVDAGVDQHHLLKDSLTLNATIEDVESELVDLDVSWHVLSSSGDVFMSSPESPRNTVSFGYHGEYMFRVTVNDGEFSRSDTVRIFVSQGDMELVGLNPESALLLVSGESMAYGQSDVNVRASKMDGNWYQALILPDSSVPGVEARRIPGTSYVGPDEDMTVEIGDKIRFQHQFVLPPNVQDAGLQLWYHAKDKATVLLNGVRIGGQTRANLTENYTGNSDFAAVSHTRLFNDGTHVPVFTELVDWTNSVPIINVIKWVEEVQGANEIVWDTPQPWDNEIEWSESLESNLIPHPDSGAIRWTNNIAAGDQFASWRSWVTITNIIPAAEGDGGGANICTATNIVQGYNVLEFEVEKAEAGKVMVDYLAQIHYEVGLGVNTNVLEVAIISPEQGAESNSGVLQVEIEASSLDPALEVSRIELYDLRNAVDGYAPEQLLSGEEYVGSAEYDDESGKWIVNMYHLEPGVHAFRARAYSVGDEVTATSQIVVIGVAEEAGGMISESITLSSPTEGAKYLIPTNVVFRVDVSLADADVQYVEYLVDHKVVGAVTNATDFEFVWESPRKGRAITYALVHMVDQSTYVTAPVNFDVEWDMHLGGVMKSETDLSISAAGMPLAISRGYDSRNIQTGDLGAGWHLDMRMKVNLDDLGSLGDGWKAAESVVTENGVLTTNMVVVATENHRISLQVPGMGNVDFVAKVEGNTGIGTPGEGNPANNLRDDKLYFEATSGKAEMYIVSSEGDSPQPEWVTVSSIGSQWNEGMQLWLSNIHSPTRFLLYTMDGREILFKSDGQIEWMSDRNGNFIKYHDDGMEWYNDNNAGSMHVKWRRDPYGRINEIYDPVGLNPDGSIGNGYPVVRYVYDGANRLSEVWKLIDRDDSFSYVKTRYVYEDANYPLLLTGIINDNGIRSETFHYDSKGRIELEVDALGYAVRHVYNEVDLKYTRRSKMGYETHTYFDHSGRPVREEKPTGETSDITYNSKGQPSRVEDQNGNSQTMEYDAKGQVAKLVSSDNKEIEVEYDEFGQVSKRLVRQFSDGGTEEDPEPVVEVSNTTQEVERDSSGNVTVVKNPDGTSQGALYNSIGLPTVQTNTLNHVKQTSYNDFGWVSSETDEAGLTTSYTYDANGNRLTETVQSQDHGDLITTYTYDAQGRVLTVIDPQGLGTTNVYDNLGLRLYSKTHRGKGAISQYDGMGQVIKTVSPDGLLSQNIFNAEGQRMETIDHNGRMTQYLYDDAGRVIQTILPGGITNNTVIYGSKDRKLATINAMGVYTGYGYDSKGRMEGVVNALADASYEQVIRYGFDEKDRQYVYTLDESNEIVRVATNIYDNMDRIIRVEYIDGTTNKTVYDAAGREIQKIDALGVKTGFKYDPVGRLLSVTNAFGTTAETVTSYEYDDLGNQTKQIDAKGQITSYTYDSAGRRLSRTLPQGQTETYTYNDVGELVSKTDFNGLETQFTYDDRGRMITRSTDGHGDVPAETHSFSYTIYGQRETMKVEASDPDIPVYEEVYEYDLDQRLQTKTSIWYGPGSVVLMENTLYYSYDILGNLTSIQSSTPGGASMTYEYDPLDRLEQVRDKNGDATVYTYDEVGSLNSVNYPNGVTHAYTYDVRQRLEKLQILQGVNERMTYDYSLNASGVRTNILETYADSTTRNAAYEYDLHNRMTKETISSSAVNPIYGSLTYTFDAVGNRLSRTTTDTIGSIIPSDAYQFTANDWLYDATIGFDQYDDNGNTVHGILPNGDTPQDLYDFQNRLIQRTEGTNVISILYDADGRRVAKTVNGVTTLYVVSALNLTGYHQVIEEHTLTNSVVTLATSYTYGHDLFSQHHSSEGTRYYEYDGQGTVRSLSDAWGAQTDTYTYDAYGNLYAKSGYSSNNYLYTGEQYDPNLQLYYLRARYNNPATGRFWTMDSYEGAQQEPFSLHKYSYAYNNPVEYIDPTGNFGLAGAFAGMGIAGHVRSLHMGAVLAVYDALRISIEGVASGMSQTQILGQFFLEEMVGLAVGWAAGKVIDGVRYFLSDIFSTGASAAARTTTRGVPIASAVKKDTRGRVTDLTATISSANLRGGTGTTQAARDWVQSFGDYEAGHLVAKLFGGRGGRNSDNIVPMTRNMNRSQWRSMEREVYGLLKQGQGVTVTIKLKYNSSTDVPDTLIFGYRSTSGVAKRETMHQ